MVFFASVFVAMLPPDPPVWLIAALAATTAANEVLWYLLVATCIRVEGLRSAYIRAKPSVDRLTAALLAVIAIRLLTAAFA